MTESSLLEARDITVRFGGVRAVSGVTFTAAANALYCIIGPNGAGKSTFLNVLTGTLRPNSGQVRFAGRDITGLPPHRIAKAGIARKFQAPSLFTSLSVWDNLCVAGCTEQPTPGRKTFAQILRQIGMQQRAHVLVGELAHGEKQWLEIGMAMALCPKLLLLDEPTAGMTPEETLQTAALLQTLRAECTVVAVEHDLRFVRAMNCNTLVLHQGQVLRSGTFADIEADELVRDVYLGRA
jgi:ABC-type uncharacterized transport system ATPase subunit